MRSVCLPHTALPGTSALLADYLYHFERVEGFYEHSPHDPDSLKRASIAAARIPDERRQAVVSALRTVNGDKASLDLLELPDTVAVVTGQQVGLFSGPAYTVYKALTAAKLARQLGESGIRAVPVFWLATEDHDFAEVDHAFVFGPGHRPAKLTATGSGSPGQPAGSVPIRDLPLDELRQQLAGFLYRDEVLALVEESYRPGRSFGESFRELLSRMLAGYGLVFVDPLEPSLRAVAAPFLREALRHMDDLGGGVRRRGAELKAAGYHAQVLFEEHSSLFFLLDHGKRLVLRTRDGAFFHEARRLESSELADRAADLSPNALLRPVLQDWLLPTAAYIGGPAELAYLAQSRVLYDALLGRAPVALPRSGFTLLDERAYALLEKYELSVTDSFNGEEALREDIAARLIPPALDASFKDAARSTAGLLESLEREAGAFDPTLGSAMAKSKAKILYQLDKNRRKAAREALRRDARVAAGAAHLSGLLFPDRHLQERLYSILPFLAKHGPGLIDTLFENVHRGCPDHLLLTV